MAGVQEMCARIGIATKRGLIGNLKLHTPSLVIYLVALLMFAANTFNLAANLSGIVATIRLVYPIPPLLLGSSIVILILSGLIFFSYQRLALIFRWLTLPLLAYIGSAFLSGLSLQQMLSHTFIPQFTFDRTTLIILTAILGTTISPYLFFWQTSEEVEEGRLSPNKEIKDMRLDVGLGMAFSNLVSYFIVATAAATFHRQGITTLTSIDQATKSLVPIAGPFASILFALGILGTGVLAIPVLAGSAAYVVSECFGWREGLGRKFHQAPRFYLVIILSCLLGLALSLVSLDPIKLLFYTAVVYGVLSPILILLILTIGNNKAIMGEQVNGRVSNFLNLGTFTIMSLAATGLLFAR
jgi:Mn2+/Fe2+ NRAMP family transporter